MGRKTKAYTRKHLRGKGVREAEEPRGFRLSKRWQRHDQEIRRNTEGCEPDFARLP